MTVTLTASYREVLNPDTVTLIDKLVDENYELSDMLVFIDEHDESDFVEYYEEYVELGEQYGYESVDAYLTLYDVSDLNEFSGRYIGEFCSAARMAEDYFDDETSRLDYRISVDWTETGNYLLDHDVDNVGDFYFRCYY